MKYKTILNIIGTTALMAGIYLVTFIILLIAITDWMNSDFLGSTGGIEMTWLLSFYWFIPFALISNILTSLTLFRRWEMWLPILFIIFFFLLMNWGFWPLHKRMILCAVGYSIAAYSVIFGKLILRRIQVSRT